MSSFSKPLNVLVSGASGFLAAWVVRVILEDGHRVRGTVRSKPKGDYLKQLFKEHGDRFEYVVVEDIEKEGAFDEAVKGMEAVVHTASPFHMKADDPQELIGPAVKGTTDILRSVLRHAPDVRRVVITSSIAAVARSPPPRDVSESTVFSERDWNDESPKIVEEMGRDAPQIHKYKASKTLAERAAWEFMENHKGEIKWDLVTLQPPFIFGPVIHDVASASALNTSSGDFLAVLKNVPERSVKDLASSVGSCVDVRDVAWAHAAALVNDRVANVDRDAAFKEGKGRVTLSAGPFTWQDVVDALSTSLPKTTVRGEPGAGKQTVHGIIIDSSRAREELGLEFRSMEETFVDTLNCFKQRGWLS